MGTKFLDIESTLFVIGAFDIVDDDPVSFGVSYGIGSERVTQIWAVDALADEISS